jgi:hypothetical protein
MDLEPGRIGFMSTQRWESHSTPTHHWIGALGDWQSLSDTACAENREQLEVARTAFQSCSFATALTAPIWKATNSVQLDSCTSRLFQVVRPEIRRGLLPVWEGCRTIFSPTVSRRSSLPLIPRPPVLENLHPASPQFPAARGRRTERYDGKRNLYLQHAP